MTRDESTVVFIGEASVGKTSIIRRLGGGGFTDQTVPTIGACHVALDPESADGSSWTIGIWDTAGHEAYHSVTFSFLRRGDVAVLVFSLSDPSSLDALTYWKTLIDEARGRLPCILVGNKQDLDPLVSDDEAIGWLEENQVNQYIKLSSQTGQGIADLRRALFQICSSTGPTFAADAPCMCEDPKKLTQGGKTPCC
jgi:small GTP-binding protein